MTILGWHKEGCNAVAFAEVDHGAGNAGRAQQGLARTLVAVHKQRELSIQSTHWLVVGSKRGQISLWDLY